MVGGEHLSEIDFEEQDLLDREALTESFHRLSCQAKILGDVMVQVPEEKWGETESLSEGDTKVSQ